MTSEYQSVTQEAQHLKLSSVANHIKLKERSLQRN
jgi:hypothetical protein